MTDVINISQFEEELSVASRVAIEAGENILAALNRPKNIDLKGDGNIDFVTQTDRNNEKLIMERIHKHFPSHLFIGEESSADNGEIPPLTDSPTWIVDPVDGTTNFIHSFPFSCVSIGYAVNRQVVVGVVYAPSTHELFECVRGYGVYCNGQRVRVSDAQCIQESLIDSEFGYVREEKRLDTILRCLRAVTGAGAHAVRQLGSGALDLCYVACGRLDAVYAGVAGEGWSPWDYAAGSLMVTEAGGVMATVDGVPFSLHGKSVLATSSVALSKEIQ
eukprot:CAMPEP_0182418278 /NCGR_PEP_ID=MMETSP1167-20130531/2757_1 /TAXON_ID=2988 /ORGANISM="Mallomonas Sp, Strain CCMP3275" /LENGTH=274 /DNA_ID=CAMNT_0024592419 /DNA_START=234 /DNA_END=1055 /DNA_ORIENTATION=-